MVDVGMAFLQAKTGNTRLLKRASGEDLTMVRYGAYLPYDVSDGVNDDDEMLANEEGDAIAGFNSNDGAITFTANDLKDRDFTADVTIHELAHNWDDESPFFGEWLALSGWAETDVPNADQELSLDGEWVFAKTASFARGYGTTNPYEDFATAMELSFQLETGRGRSVPCMKPKLDFIQAFFSRLAMLP